MENEFKKYVQGKGRKDLTLLFSDRDAFQKVIDEMAKPFASLDITKVVGLDALGFVFVAPIAQKLNVGFALLRKQGKVPVEKEIVSFTDYSNTLKSFEIASNAIESGDRVLLVDEWSETGSQVKAAIELVERMGAQIVGITCFNIDQKVMENAEFAKYKLYSVL